MSGELKTAMDALAAALATACPNRLVGRNFKPMAQRTDEDLLTGILSLACLGEQDYANYRGREADLGKLKVVLIGQLAVAADAEPSALEDAEFVMAEEVKAFLALPPPYPLVECLATGYRQSGQLEHPYGWVAFELEVRGDG